jgi:competence protein ComEC
MSAPLYLHARRTSAALLLAVLAAHAQAAISVHQIDVGLGNCTLVTCDGGKTAMVDTGSTQSVGAVYQYMRGLNLSTVDVLFISHADRDHFAGAAELAAAGIWFHEVWDNGHITNLPWVAQPEASNYHRALGDRRATIGAGMTWALGSNTAVQCLYACGRYVDGTRVDYDRVENNASAVLLLTHGRYRHLLPGDIHTHIEEHLGGVCGRISALTVAHHGLSGSSSAAFLEAARPRLALISAAGLQAFPNPGVVDRLEAVGARVYLTRRGAGPRGTVATNIVVHTDGRTGFSVEGYERFTFPAAHTYLRWAGVIIALLVCYGLFRSALARLPVAHR